MKYDDMTWKKIEAGRDALENLARATRTGRTIEQSLLLSNRQLILNLVENGVERKAICDALSEATGVLVNIEILNNFIERKDANTIDFIGAADAIKKLSKKPELAKNANTSVAAFLQKNKSEILHLIETGLSMRKVMNVLRKYGVVCSPDMVKRHIGYIPKKKRSKVSWEIEKRKDNINEDSFQSRLDQSTKNNMSDINTSFRNNEGVSKYFKK